MKRYLTLIPHKRKQTSFLLGVGDITGTAQKKKLHLRYVADGLREEAGILCCLAAAILSIRALKAVVWEWVFDWLLGSGR